MKLSDEYIQKVIVNGKAEHNQTIVLKPYDENWPVLFEREKQRISTILKNKALMIEHIGSTSVPGLAAKPIIDELINKGHVTYPYLGVGVLDKQTAAQAGYKLNVDAGVIVMQLELGSPADQAGIRQRDLILKIDGKDTNTVADLRSIIAEHKVGDNITITISRNGQVGDVTATLAEMPTNN